ncbi:uncharacterized protein BJX67DRAFT_382535 [Aspergillus lucknowensis]|uniref:Uncharacterized protein n=1 Tax=Aspergillus lucknowensis TaxID=176173 RepID=A0ABR4LMV4_9EURO
MGHDDKCSGGFEPDSQRTTEQRRASQLDQDQRNHDEVEISRIEDFPPGIYGHFLSVQTVKPYAIEEPEDGTTSDSDKSSQAQQGGASPWEDLVGSMEDLYCGSDTSNPAPSYHTRGKKRKPANIVPSLFRSSQQRQPTPVLDLHYEGPNISPKRQRRKSRPSKNTEEYRNATQGQRTCTTHEFGTSSSDSPSTDTSGTPCLSGSASPDAMDID